MINGRCECGSVRFEIEKVRDSVTVCHCSQCRRTSGHLWASTHAPADSVRFISYGGLTWYKSSDWAERGFCRHCGSSLFYRMKDEENLSIAAGSLDPSAGLHLGKHIFVRDKGDYYQISDKEEQIETY